MCEKRETGEEWPGGGVRNIVCSARMTFGGWSAVVNGVRGLATHGEAGLDLRSADGVAGIAIRQSPMKGISQHDDGQQMDWSRRTRRSKCVAQQVDVLDKQVASTLQQVHSEKLVPPGTRTRR